jgi:hypothetical protein
MTGPRRKHLRSLASVIVIGFIAAVLVQIGDRSAQQASEPRAEAHVATASSDDATIGVDIDEADILRSLNESSARALRSYLDDSKSRNAEAESAIPEWDWSRVPGAPHPIVDDAPSA